MEKDFGLSGTQRPSTFDLQQQYIELLAPYKDQLVDHSLTCQPLMKGELYNRNVIKCKTGKEKLNILFVGRAVNGWEIDFRPGSIEELTSQVFESNTNIADVARGKLESGYNYNRSPFFQLCHAILSEFSIEFEQDWAKRFAWTNLYKIAPYNSGNPNNTLIGETIDMCASILRLEISHLRPTHIVFITDAWWYKPHGFMKSKEPIHETAFSNMLDVDVFEEAKGSIVGCGISSAFRFTPKIVITKRPEGAKLSRAAQAKQIIDAFSTIQVQTQQK